MNSSNNQLANLSSEHGSKHDPGFALIVAFDYYDGPERGLALYPSGEGVKFSSVGDSKSRLFRAFELTVIKGNWWPQVRELPEYHGITPSVQVLVAIESSEALMMLEQNVMHAAEVGRYLGIGPSSLEWLMVGSFPEEQLGTIRQLSGSVEGFRLVHQILKRQSQSRIGIVP